MQFKTKKLKERREMKSRLKNSGSNELSDVEVTVTSGKLSKQKLIMSFALSTSNCFQIQRVPSVEIILSFSNGVTIQHHIDAKGAIDRSATSHGPLHGKSVYLDLVHHKNVAELEKKLQLVGATVERCFSREVSSVITDREITSFSGGPKREASQPITSANSDCNLPVVSPSSGASPVSRSLFGNIGSTAHRSGCGTPSPLCQSSPAYSSNTADGPCRPVTRGQAIAQKANLTRNYGSTNVLECAKQWGIRVVNVKKAEKWLEKEADKLPKKSKVKEPKAKVHKISEPYLKVEDLNRRHRPQFQRLQSVPTVKMHGILGLGVFEELVSCQHEDVGKVAPSSKAKAKRLCDDKIETAKVVSPCQSSVSKRKLVVKPGGRIKLRVSRTTRTTGMLRNKSRYGFCEICDVNYEDVKTVQLYQFSYKLVDCGIVEKDLLNLCFKFHCKSEPHREKSSDASIYRQLDSVIEDGLTLQSYLRRRVVTVSPFRSGRVDGCDESPEIRIASSPQSSRKSTLYPSRVRLLPVLRNSPHRSRVNTSMSTLAAGQLPVNCSKTWMKPACHMNPLQVSKCCAIDSKNDGSAKGGNDSFAQVKLFTEVPAARRISRARRNLNPTDTAEADVKNLRNSSIPSVGESLIRCSSAAGRVSPEIPVMGRISRTPKKLIPYNMAKTDIFKPRNVTIPSCEESRINCSAITSLCDADGFGVSVSHANWSVIGPERSSLLSSPALSLSLWNDYFYSDRHSLVLPFNGFDDFSQSDTRRLDDLPDLEMSELEHSVDSFSPFSSDWGNGPRILGLNSLDVVVEAERRCSYSSCKKLLSETHHNVAELVRVTDASEKMDSEDDASDVCCIPVVANGAVDLLDEEDPLSNAVRLCSDSFSAAIVFTDVESAFIGNCPAVDNNENEAEHRCSPPILTKPDSGCLCWKPVVSITRLSRPV